MCLRLFLLSSSHHLHSICSNHLLSLVVQVEFILNSCLWVHPNPISELQHTFLPLKCCKLGTIPWFLFFFFFPLLMLFHFGTHIWVLEGIWGCVSIQLIRYVEKFHNFRQKRARVVTQTMNENWGEIDYVGWMPSHVDD